MNQQNYIKKFIDGKQKSTLDYYKWNNVDDEVQELADNCLTKWTVSLEGTDALYEYIRGGKNFTFNQLNDNLKQYDFDRI